MNKPRRSWAARVGGMAVWIRGVLLREREDASWDEQMRFHIEMETKKNLGLGMSHGEARRRALVAFGGIERYRETLREGRRLPVLEPLWLDLRFGARFLARDRVLSSVAALTVALGVGATATVFSALNAILLRPLPLLDGARLVSVQEARNGAVSNGLEGMLLPYPRVLAYREATGDVFESLAAHRLVDGFSLRLDDVTISVNGALTTGNYFQTLGIQPMLGRAYDSDGADEIVLSHSLWSSRFQADPHVLGRSVGLDGRTVTVVGVATDGFNGVTAIADHLWTSAHLGNAPRDSWDIRMVPLARLREGVSLERAAAAANAAALAIPPNENATVRAANLELLQRVPDRMSIRATVTGFFGLILGMAFLVLLIAASNIAGVMLSRGFARRKELAIRLAIGAGRARLVRQLLAETLLVFFVGGGLGIGLAYLGTAWLVGLELPALLPAVLLDLTPDLGVVAFAVFVTAGTGIVFGLAPAFTSSRPDLVPALKGLGGSPRPRDTRLRNFFVGAQVTFAVTVLLTGTLFMRSLQAGLRTDIGFDPDGVVTATVGLGASLGYDRASASAFQGTLIDRVRMQPGVEGVALAQYVPLGGKRSGGGVSRADVTDGPAVNAAVNTVSPSFFEALGVPVVAGRPFSTTDAEGSPPVVMINETLAKRLWPGASPLGQLIRTPFLREPAEVVGVTADGRYTFVSEEPTAFLYLPLLQVPRSQIALLARAPGAEDATLARIAEVVRLLDPNVAVKAPLRLEQIAATSLFPARFAAQVVGGFGLVGLILGALGIYGVLAYQVSRRTRELGIRRALGATTTRLVAGVVAQGGTIAAVGCALGMLLGGALAYLARGLLFGIRPLDPIAFTAVPALLFLIALIASVVPARKAGAVQPSDALREE